MKNHSSANSHQRCNEAKPHPSSIICMHWYMVLKNHYNQST